MGDLNVWANIAQIVSVIGPIVLFIFVVIIRREVSAVYREQKPNGGSSMLDKLNKRFDRQDEKFDALAREVSEIKGAFNQHMREQ